MKRTPCLTHINKFDAFHLFSSTAKLNINNVAKCTLGAATASQGLAAGRRCTEQKVKTKSELVGMWAAKAQRQPVGVAVWSKTLKWLGPVWEAEGLGLPGRKMTEQKNHWRVIPLAACRKREHHMLSTELIHARRGWRDGQAGRCLLSIKVELAGLTEEVSSLQTRGPQPGLHGGGSRHHSSGGVGSKKSNTSQVRWVGGQWR